MSMRQTPSFWQSWCPVKDWTHNFLSPSEQAEYDEFRASPAQRVERIMQWWEIYETDMLVLSEVWMSACEIARIKALWVLKNTSFWKAIQ